MKKTKTFELKLPYLEEKEKLQSGDFDLYLGGQYSVICNGIQITKNKINNKDFLGDHYFSTIEYFLKGVINVLTNYEVVTVPVLDNPFQFRLHREGNNIGVSFHYIAVESQTEREKIDQNYTGEGKSIYVILDDFVEEILDKSRRFVSMMDEKMSHTDYPKHKRPEVELELNKLKKLRQEAEESWEKFRKQNEV